MLEEAITNSSKTSRLHGTANERLRYFAEDEQRRVEKCRALCSGCDGKSCRQEKSSQYLVPEFKWDDKSMFGYTVAYSECLHKRRVAEDARYKSLFKFSGTPKKFDGMGLDTFTRTKGNENAVKAAEWLMEQDKHGAFFYGTCGVGKTRLAATVANQKMRKGKKVLFAYFPDLLEDIKASFEKHNTSEVLEKVRTVPFLVLDDLGAERMSEWVGSQLVNLLNYRADNDLQTVFTSNYDLDEISRRLRFVDTHGATDKQDQRIMSRIFALCPKYAFVKVTGEDYRMKGIS